MDHVADQIDTSIAAGRMMLFILILMSLSPTGSVTHGLIAK